MITFKDFLSLTKFNLSFVVSLSLLFGYILSKNQLDILVLHPFLAVLLLALGVSALNQVQEYKEDALMTRTKKRPIASGRVSYKTGLLIASTLIFLALIFIYKTLNTLGVFIFLFVIFVYNYFYTKAKKVTVYAAVYGAILGVIPPLIGWISANGNIKDLEFLALALFYFIWQIPHFWLLVLKYHKEYEKASFPTIIKIFGVQGVERITSIWLMLTLISGTYLFLVFSPDSILITTLFILTNLVILYKIYLLLSKHKYIHTFIFINLYMLFIMILLCINSLFYN